MWKQITSSEDVRTPGSGVIFLSMIMTIVMVNALPSSLLTPLLTFSCWLTALAALGSYINTHSLAAKSSSKLINGTPKAESRSDSQSTLVANTPASTADSSVAAAIHAGIPELDQSAVPIQPAVADAIADDADVDVLHGMAITNELFFGEPAAVARSASPDDIVDIIGGYGMPDNVDDEEEEIQRQALEALDEWDQEAVAKLDESGKSLLAELLVFVSAPPPTTLAPQGLIGSGATAGVHRVTDPKTGVVCAAKVIRHDRDMGGNPQEALGWWVQLAVHGRRCFEAEAGLTMRLQGQPNIVRFLGEGEESIPGALEFPHKWMLLELALGCLQWADLTKRKAALGCLRDLACALEYLQQEGVIHNDIKPGNVLVFNARDTGVKAVPGLSSTRKVYKIADFGLAGTPASMKQATHFCGTWEYAAPEAIGGNEFSFQSDLYSAYITWMEGRGLLTDGVLPNNILKEGLAVYRQREVGEAMRQDSMFQGEPFWEMICIDPASRPSATEVVSMVDTVLAADVKFNAACLRRRHHSKIPIRVKK